MGNMQFPLEDLYTPFVTPLEDKGHRFMPLFQWRAVHPYNALSIFLAGSFCPWNLYYDCSGQVAWWPGKRLH